jgi:hypothetical protein
MGHHGDTYQQFYLPNLIERDFQSIYFGTPSQDDLIQHAARMGISRDEQAPTGLTNEQKLEFKSELDRHPEILRLRAKRERYKHKISRKGYHFADAAKGTKLYDRYNELNASSIVLQTSCANGKRIRLFSIFTTPSTIIILKGSEPQR